jgi:hypothetical protein
MENGRWSAVRYGRTWCCLASGGGARAPTDWLCPGHHLRPQGLVGRVLNRHPPAAQHGPLARAASPRPDPAPGTSRPALYPCDARRSLVSGRGFRRPIRFRRVPATPASGRPARPGARSARPGPLPSLGSSASPRRRFPRRRADSPPLVPGGLRVRDASATPVPPRSPLAHAGRPRFGVPRGMPLIGRERPRRLLSPRPRGSPQGIALPSRGVHSSHRADDFLRAASPRRKRFMHCSGTKLVALGRPRAEAFDACTNIAIETAWLATFENECTRAAGPPATRHDARVAIAQRACVLERYAGALRMPDLPLIVGFELRAQPSQTAPVLDAPIFPAGETGPWGPDRILAPLGSLLLPQVAASAESPLRN